VKKKLTITVDPSVYDGLCRVIGPRRISQLIEHLVRPHGVEQNGAAAYADMAADEAREIDAEEWADALLPDVADEAEGPFRKLFSDPIRAPVRAARPGTS